MKTIWLWILFGSLLLTGCASTIPSRKQERLAAYQTLSVEQRIAVDAGQIQIGMPMDAVYIAWGKPSQVMAGDPAEGVTAIWVYRGSSLDERGYWNHYDSFHQDRYYAAPYTTYDYQSRRYVRAEVKFAGDAVKEWHSLNQAGH